MSTDGRVSAQGQTGPTTQDEAPANPDIARYPDRALIGAVRSIVNHVLDLSGADVKTRQAINDECDAYVHAEVERQITAARAQALREFILGMIVGAK